ncbi:MAG: YmdB family metallophosphoesterase [Oscillospiraceae bacterium]|jgi:metallophosphoesterase (TIGR00282 family)|nr:YmdB family metallophosphoesterase [Oscillospiraceae bacterium]
MKVLMIGDVVGEAGCEFLCCRLPEIIKRLNIDVVIANGENSAAGNGVSYKSVKKLVSAGVDVITTGNHAFRKKQAARLFSECDFLLRPINLPAGFSGHGVFVYDKGHFQLCIINVMGCAFMKMPSTSAFESIEAVLAQHQYPATVIDFHAESTAEKKLLGFQVDGHVSAVVGTHTHVQTADEQILPKGTAYISDLGMVGVCVSVLGADPTEIDFKAATDGFFQCKPAVGPHEINGVILTIDSTTGKAREIIRVKYL